MVTINYDDLAAAFDFVSVAAPMEHLAYLSLDTGAIYWISEGNPVDDEELPDDLDTSDRYVAVPHKNELDLGNNLALRFVEEELPERYAIVTSFFRRRGAYARFKELLAAEGCLEKWHAFEAESTERALRDWCKANEIRVAEDGLITKELTDGDVSNSEGRGHQEASGGDDECALPAETSGDWPKAAITRSRSATANGARPTANRPSVIPMISYEDGIAALGWLRVAFDFRETVRLTTPDGTLSHGEMEAGDGLIMLASPTPEYRSPKHHREVCEQARQWSTVPWIIDGVLVHVDDLDRHFARAKAAGAVILSDIEEGPPGRRYRAEDFEGHRWFFFEKDHG